MTLKASSWMITFHAKEMKYPLINGNRNIKEDMSYLKLMTYTGLTRMGMMTPIMDSLALKFNFWVVQVTYGSETYESTGRATMDK